MCYNSSLVYAIVLIVLFFIIFQPNRPNTLNVTGHSPLNNRSPLVVEMDEINIDPNNLPSLEQISQECSLISVNWQSFQNLKVCNCSTPLEPYSTKLHCYACGQIFCIRCIDKRSILPCHTSKSARQVCHKCFMSITRSTSIDL